MFSYMFPASLIGYGVPTSESMLKARTTHLVGIGHFEFDADIQDTPFQVLLSGYQTYPCYCCEIFCPFSFVSNLNSKLKSRNGADVF